MSCAAEGAKPTTATLECVWKFACGHVPLAPVAACCAPRCCNLHSHSLQFLKQERAQ